jgi:RNA polymerase sigma factor (sigma-70 family)
VDEAAAKAKAKAKERALDAYLAAAARTGDRAAFALLARRWDARLLAHARRLLGNGEEAREAVQEGWAEIVRGLPRLAAVEAFPAWAYRIVTRRCARLIGAAQRRRRLDAALEREERAQGAEPEGEARDAAARLQAAVRALPPAQRAAIALHHFEELSVAETAVALDVPAGTVKTRLMHARRKLRAILEGEE